MPDDDRQALLAAEIESLKGRLAAQVFAYPPASNGSGKPPAEVAQRGMQGAFARACAEHSYRPRG
jgi:hypothetical protein